MNPALHARASDHLRAQEPIKIIAINRRTGYIGSVSTEYMDIEENPGLISFPIDHLVMRPPNLKIMAERKTRAEAGMTQCSRVECEDEYLIGYEGAATTDDTILTITTEWYDHDGSPLPEGLAEYGYTGRLAKVTGPSVTIDGGQLAQFAVKPGRHLQTVRFSGDYNTSEHFYLQINGEPTTENPDFSILGAAEEGPLQYRPKHYVPFLVPLENEDASIRQYNAYRELLRDDSIPNDQIVNYGAVHHWFYRPEMQFSMYDLEVNNIFRQADQEDSSVIDIYPEAQPVIASSDDIVSIAYDLMAQQFEALPYLGAGQELVFAFGEEEIAATLDEDANIVFTNLEHFAALDPEDFLSIRLYSNNDPGNVLWEYAFDSFGLIADMNMDGQIFRKKKDDPHSIKDTHNTVDNPFLFWINDDDDDGEINEGKGAGGDIPGDNTPDWANQNVDGMRDLIDFFPVYVDIKSATENYPIHQYDYKLREASASLRFFTSVTTNKLLPTSDDVSKRPDAILKHRLTAASVAVNAVQTITSAGVLLESNFLTSAHS